MTSKNPLVTAIIPAYDRPERTERAIRSVVEQTYDPIELIVVDDGSDPPLRKTISTRRGQLAEFQLVEHETNRGANAARNTGIEAASGEYIAFLDSDDEWRPTKLERQGERFRHATDSVGLVYTGIIQKGPNGNITSRSVPDREGRVLAALLKGNFIGTFSSVMVRAEVTDEIRLNEDLPSWQDWDFYLEVAKEWEVSPIREPLVVKYSGGSDRISGKFKQKQEISYPILKEKIRELSTINEQTSSRQALAALDFRLGYNALTNGYFSEARRYFGYALSKNPLQKRAWIYLAVSLCGNRIYTFLQNIKRSDTIRRMFLK